MFYEEHTEHGNAHRYLTVFSAFPLSALLSHPCLRSHSWALLLLSLPVVPDSSLFRHHFVCLEEASRRDRTFPEFLHLCLHFCLHFTCQSFSLLSFCLFHGISFLTPVSMFSVTWVENDLTEHWEGVQVLDFPGQLLFVSANLCFCDGPCISPWSWNLWVQGPLESDNWDERSPHPFGPCDPLPFLIQMGSCFPVGVGLAQSLFLIVIHLYRNPFITTNLKIWRLIYFFPLQPLTTHHTIAERGFPCQFCPFMSFPLTPFSFSAS